MVKATWGVFVDWNNDFDYSDTGENVTARVLNEPGIVTVRGRDTIRALAPPAAGSCDFALNNASKDYSPAYVSGPLYGNLVPGRAILINTSAPSSASIWTGTVDDLPQEPFAQGGGRVRVPGLGKLAKLRGVRVSCYLRTNITTSAALAALFAAAGLAPGEYTMLDTGQTTLALWWAGDDDAFEMMARLLAAEGPGAAIYERGDGVIAFHSRHYRLLTSRCTTSQATFGNASTEPKHSPPFGYEPNLKGVVNSVALTTKVGTLAGSATEVWTWTGNINLAPGANLYFDVSLSEPGVDFTPAVTFTGGGISTALGNYEDMGATAAAGTRVYLQVTNVSSPAQATNITAISVSAKVYASATEIVRHEVDTSASRAKYGVRALPGSFNPWPYLAPNVARGFADYIAAAYQEPRATVMVTVKNGTSARLAQQLAREISDRITVTESQTGLSEPVFIERIRHEVREGGRFHTTQFFCETIPATGLGGLGVYDTAVYDTARYGY